MKSRRLLVSLLIAVPVSISACVGAGTPLPPSASASAGVGARTAAPAPAGALPLQLETAAPETPPPSSAPLACNAARVVPVRVTVLDQRVVLITVAGGTKVDAIWPRGFAAWSVNGVVSINAPDGSLVGRVGDILTGLGGGEHICEVNGKYYIPPG